MTELPEGWAETEISEIATYVSRGRSPKYIASSGLPVINQRCVRWHGVDEHHVKFVDPTTWHQWDDDRYVRINDILWNSTGTGTIGRAALFKGLPSYEKAVVDSHVTIIRSGEAVDPSYLFNFIRSPAIQDKIEDMQSGSTNQVELNRSEILSTKVPLAPLPEQRRIVTKVDRLAVHIVRAHQELDRVPVLVARYKQRLLGLAFSGELTSEWRDKNCLATSDEIELGEVAEGFNYGSAAKSSRKGSVPVLRMGNIQDGKLDWGDLVFTSSPNEIAKYRLEPGDVLFNRTNSPELVGKTALFRGEREAIYAGYLIKIRCGPKLMPEFLTYCLNSPLGRAYSWQVKTDGVSQSNINARKLAAFRFGLPTMEEQAEIVRRIETAFAWLDRLITDHAAAARLLPKLDAAILTMAFRGELVSQDPGDEPASALLAGIATERNQKASKQAPRRKASSHRLPLDNNIDIALKHTSPKHPTPRQLPMTKSRQDEDVMGKPYLANKLKELRSADVQELFRAADLPVADFYKQLIWEISKGHIVDRDDEIKVA